MNTSFLKTICVLSLSLAATGFAAELRVRPGVTLLSQSLRADDTLRLVTESARLILPNVAHESSDYAFIFPIIGNGAGAFGTFFRSEATVANTLSRDQDVVVIYFPLGNAAGCGGGLSKTF